MKSRQALGATSRWVIKVGSSLVTRDGRGLDHEIIASWVEDIVGLSNAGKKIVLVSSGSVAEGMSRLGLSKRPRALNDLQATAAIGQMGLVQAYESRFQQHGMHTAQVLLTHEDLSDRRRYLNARSTLNRLLELSVIPVINENDTVAMEEIQFGDNDRLAALVANLVEADLMIILTDQGGMYDDNPSNNPQAKLLDQVKVDDERLDSMASGSGILGRGGMITKVQAARLAARSGTATIIASGREKNILGRISAGENLGTLFCPAHEPMAARKQWLAGQVVLSGKLVLDDGAVEVLCKSGRSLLPVGVKEVSGRFQRGAIVACVDSQGHEIARGLINYSSDEIARIKGQPSAMIEGLLGYIDEPELIHRDNLVVI
ncbi:MAG: glutamate 5-kinase [Gammaproteobacteria bacterium]|nr:MAG: glutamate 5-kinase [Gammaproteobacteria bacterium]